MSNPVRPGQAASFTWTVTNLTNATEDYQLCDVVPSFTTQNGYGAGTRICTSFVALAGGTSNTGIITLNVLGGTAAPPNGTPINLTLSNYYDGSSISNNVRIGSSPASAFGLWGLSPE